MQPVGVPVNRTVFPENRTTRRRSGICGNKCHSVRLHIFALIRSAKDLGLGAILLKPRRKKQRVLFPASPEEFYVRRLKVYARRLPHAQDLRPLALALQPQGQMNRQRGARLPSRPQGRDSHQWESHSRQWESGTSPAVLNAVSLPVYWAASSCRAWYPALPEDASVENNTPGVENNTSGPASALCELPAK